MTNLPFVAGSVLQCRQDALITMFRLQRNREEAVVLNARMKRCLLALIPAFACVITYLTGWMDLTPFIFWFFLSLVLFLGLMTDDLVYIWQTPRYRPSSSSQADASLADQTDQAATTTGQQLATMPTPGLAPLALPDDEDEEEEDEQDDLGNLAQPHEDRPGRPVSGLLVQYQYVDQRKTP